MVRWSLPIALSAYAVAALAAPAPSAQNPPHPAPPAVTDVTLPDGLRVLMKEVHASPVVCTYVWYRVGSRNEVEPDTGISHQVEHMMFKGTLKEFPNPGYIDLLVGRFGGENNAQTDTDTTSYYLLLPSSQLDLALRIEADRMTHAAIDAKQLASEKTVVLSELEGDENDNQFYLYENTRATAFQYHPYHYPVIGTKWDVQRFTRPQVYRYYTQHYAPNNATLVVVGDFDTGKSLARIRQLWSGVARRPVAQRPLDPELPQRGERRVTVSRAGANPYLEVSYHIPAARHPDLPPLTVLATALASGRSSRLYRALVETQLATDVSAAANTGIDPELFEFDATLRPGVAPADVETALYKEVERVKTEGLQPDELQKAKNQTRAGFVFGQESVLGQAARLGAYQTIFGDWRYEQTWLERIQAVTQADIRRVAAGYLTASNRTVGTFVPNGEAPPPEADSGAGRATHYKRNRGTGDQGNSGTGRRGRPSSLTLPRRCVACSPVRPFACSVPMSGVTGEGPSQASRPVERHLPNGLTLIVQENHANPTVTLDGFVRAGSVDDPPGRFGLASLTAEMLVRGTSGRTSQQIASEVEFVGGSIGASAEHERTDLSARMLTTDLERVLGVFADVVRNPSFPADELSKAKGEGLAGLQAEQDDTGAVAARALYRALYPPADPYAHLPEGEIDTVTAITRDDIVEFYRRYYRPERTTFILVGDITAERAAELIQRLFGDWRGEGEAPPAYRPAAVSASTPPPSVMKTIPDKSQDDVLIGSLGISRTAPDYEAAAMMNLILGGDQFVGRVGKRIRDTEGLAYYAFTAFGRALAVAPFEFAAGANPRNVPRVIASAREEIARMAREGVKESELAWSKDHAIGALQISLATNGGIASEIATEAFYGLGLDYVRRYPQIVRALSKAQVNAAARKYLHPEALAVVVAGPPVPGIK